MFSRFFAIFNTLITSFGPLRTHWCFPLERLNVSFAQVPNSFCKPALEIISTHFEQQELAKKPNRQIWTFIYYIDVC
ncbi:hypothetical protein BX070DRAFT_218942 [Coemansia spiralis]|nr:hypothetical protein BX070DRAFT_218942 [Coemansia spiralis]